MPVVEIDFNDVIYRETGINLNSGSMLEEDIIAANGDVYLLQVCKKNICMKETLFLVLQDPNGLLVEDSRVVFNGREAVLGNDAIQVGIPIEVPVGTKQLEFELESPSNVLKVSLQVFLESENKVPSGDEGKMTRKAEEERTRRMSK